MYFSQSVTEKYNSLYKRYDYFDSSGNIIGYKKYNSLSRHWEYYNLNKTQYERQPRQYGNYTQPYHLDLIERALRQKQQNYDSNFQTVKATIENIINDIKTWEISADAKYKIISHFKDAISKNLDNRNIDYGSAEQTRIVIKWLNETIEIIIKNLIDNTK